MVLPVWGDRASSAPHQCRSPEADFDRDAGFRETNGMGPAPGDVPRLAILAAGRCLRLRTW